MMKLTGKFTVANWEEVEFLDVPAPQKAQEAKISYDVTGDLIGAFNGIYLMIYTGEKTAHYNGALRFEGAIGEKKGGFFVSETGIFEQGAASGNWQIIEESGTGDFSGITGTGQYAASSREVDYELTIAGL